ncbi:hypothetical protein [Cerasicoccus arenae]|uniref:Uncharacterized protein n=1 Tax=Cerasicoccus arenae TaxID=424488 RepID=A0A8J3DBE1_9BACT|nr:hypothetical protein [Cerasicoccus arenae]MBK1857581.1 hypothetical protein [Cerasicoccus arenae]GHC05777.1 hypothetical protein GCM10007047_23440 [Cerasicoccus arenae]
MKQALILSALLSTLLPAALNAQLYWDTNGATPGAGNPADGIWDTDTTPFWTTDSSGSIATVDYTTGGSTNVIFSAGADAAAANITVSSTQLISSLTVKNGNVIFSGSTLDDTGTTVDVVVDSGASATMNNTGSFNGNFNVNGTLLVNAITAGGPMTKTGTGTMTANRLDAVLTVNEGTLIYTGSVSAKLKNTTVNSGGTLRLTGNAFDGTKRSLAVNTGGRVEFGSGLTQTISLFTGGGTVSGEANSMLRVGGDNKTTTFSGAIVDQLNIASIGSGAFTLDDTSSMEFTIGANGVNNSITGDGVNDTTTNLEGEFIFNLTGADLTDGNTWLIVDVNNLNENITETFNVNGFTELSNIWTNGSGFAFSETTGILSYTSVPEASTYALILGIAAFGLIVRRK